MKEIKVINPRLLTKLLGTTKITNNWKRNKYISRRGNTFIVDPGFLADIYIKNTKQYKKMRESVELIETYFDNEDFIKVLQERLEEDDEYD